MSLKEAATEEAVLKALLDQVGDAYKAKRIEVQQLLDEAAKNNGQRNVTIEVAGAQVATVNLKSGSAEAAVTDAEALLKWVMAELPGEIERRFVTTVRPAFLKKLLDELTAANGREWADPATGVIHTVPGVAIVPNRGRTHEVRFAGGKDGPGRHAIAAAWRSRSLDLPDVTTPAAVEGGAS